MQICQLLLRTPTDRQTNQQHQKHSLPSEEITILYNIKHKTDHRVETVNPCAARPVYIHKFGTKGDVTSFIKPVDTHMSFWLSYMTCGSYIHVVAILSLILGQETK